MDDNLQALGLSAALGFLTFAAMCVYALARFPDAVEGGLKTGDFGKAERLSRVLFLSVRPLDSLSGA